MVTYQRFGVIVVTFLFGFSEELKLHLFRLLEIRGEFISSPRLNDSVTAGVSEVSKLVSKCHLTSNLIALLPCVMFAAWSDRHGRKLLLILPLIGAFISDIFLLLTLLKSTVPIFILVASESVYGVCGGMTLMTMGCLCYLTDTTDHRQRIFFLSLFWGLSNWTLIVKMNVQQFLTPAFLGYNFHRCVLVGIPIKMVVTLVSIIYVITFVSESVFILGSFQGNPWKNLLTPINISDAINCVLRKRTDNIRFFIVSLFAVFTFYSVSTYGNHLVIPQFLRKVLQWSNQGVLICLGVAVLGQTIVLWLIVNLANILDPALGTAGSLSLSGSMLILAFSKSSEITVTGMVCGVLSLLIPTSAVGMLSKLIERAETGCLYAGLGFVMLVSQFVAESSYPKLLDASLEARVPQLLFLLSFGLATFGLLFLAYLRKHITPDLLGHIDGGEGLSLINRRGQIEDLFQQRSS